MKKNKRKRRYLLDKRYQLSQSIGLLLSYLLVAFCVAVLLIWYYLFIFDTRLVLHHNNLIPAYLFCCAVALAFIAFYWSIRHSHRVAGMVFKLDMIFKDVCHGKFPERPVNFRRYDYFHWLIPSLNDALDHFREKEEHLAELHRELDKLQEQITNGTLSDAGIVLTELQRIRANTD